MRGFRLRVLNRDIELSDGEYSIGRSRDCDIPVSDDLVSRKHALLLVRKGRASIRDIGSRNGTFLNGHRIDDEQELGHLDQITVGAHDLMCIDTVRVRESPPLHRCEGCSTIVDLQDAFCRRCGTTIRNSLVGASRVEPAAREGAFLEEGGSTVAATALGVLAGVAARMLAAGNYVGAERVLEGALLDLLQEAIKSRARPDELSIASECALSLAEHLGSNRWLEWTFNIHEACAVVPSPATVDRLTELVGQVQSFDHRPISKLIERIDQSGKLTASDRFAMRRLQSLRKMVAP